MLRLITLSENAGISGGIQLDIEGSFLAEWGLSILIQYDGKNVLLDTGKSITATYNADTLGIDLNKIDTIVLSHGHDDHTGGLREMLRRIRKENIEVIAHPHVFADRYHQKEGKSEVYKGIRFMQKDLERFGASFNLTSKPVWITENIVTSGEVPMVTDFERMKQGKTRRFIKEGGEEKPDEILDDQAVFVKTEVGLVVVSGCAHRGIINTVRHGQKITGIDRVYAVVGGSHLIEASDDRIERTIEAFQELDVQKLGLCHCTGMPAIVKMAHELGDRFFFNNAGVSVEIPWPEE